MSKVEIRALRPDEVDQFVDLSYYAFHALGGSTREQVAAGFRHQDIPERQALVAVEDGTIVSTVIIFSVGTWIRGDRFPTGAIANVATTPDRLRQGHARRLLVTAVRVMRVELGLTLSTLYPTIYSLYNELGWTLVEDAHRYVGALRSFSRRHVSRRIAADTRSIARPRWRTWPSWLRFTRSLSGRAQGTSIDRGGTGRNASDLRIDPLSCAGSCSGMTPTIDPVPTPSTP